MITKFREALALASRAIFIALVLTIVLSPESVGVWIGRASVGYFVTSMDLMLGEPKK